MKKHMIHKILLYILNQYFTYLIPDIAFLKLKFHLKVGYKLNLDNPSTFNEKIQWLKLYDKNPLYKILSDKFEARKYIIEKVGKKYLIPLYGTFTSTKDIDLTVLPSRFVLKTNHDSGGVFICFDKTKFDSKYVFKKLTKKLKTNFFYRGREFSYKYIKPIIMCEKNLIPEDKNDIFDYKFLCFNGVVKSIFVVSNRKKVDGPYIDFFNENWEFQNFRRYYKNSGYSIEKPTNFKLMMRLARKLSEKIKLLRVDFYEVNSKLYIGELTLYPGSGFEAFSMKFIDEVFGSWINLS
jgi:hypothetical protein